MAQKLLLKADEESTYVVRVNFRVLSIEGKNYSIHVRNIAWTLYDEDRRIINGRNRVPADPGTYLDVILTPEDLTLVGNYPEVRVVSVSGNYDSLYGTDLPVLEEVRFQIENLVE